MAKKKKGSTPKAPTQKELKAMLAESKKALAATKASLAQAEETYTTLTTPSAAAEIPEDLQRSRVTGLSDVQEEARDTLLAIAEAQGGGYLRTAKSAGQVVAKPTTALPDGQEWKWMPKTGGGGSWIAVQVREPIKKSGGGDGGDDDGGGDSGDGGGTITYTAPDGRIFTNLDSYNAYITQLKNEERRRAGQSAYDLLFLEFDRYGMGALVEPLKALITEGLSQAEFTLRLRDTDAYRKRFAANQARINKGLRALSEAEYIGLEDQYQNVMRNYGLPASYYARGDMGRQEGFERFIAGDVSAVELEDRIQTAQNRVINAAPEISATLREFYPDISNGDILAYVLDPEKAISDIRRKVTAAEIGGAATMAGLATGVSRAEELARYGVTAEAARQGFQTIAEVAPRGGQLADIYKQSPYTQATAEQEVFNLAGAPEAAARRRRLTQLEQASFAGASGVAGGALGRERAGAF